MCAIAPPTFANSDKASTVLVLGDSISAAYGIQRETGWVALLENRLAEQASNFQVVNASISGETTGGGLARLPQALDLHNPSIVIIELGGNDGLRGYPIERIRENLQNIVTTADPNMRQIILVGMQIPPNYGRRYTDAFTQLFQDIATEHNLKLVPFFMETVALKPELMQGDGIHPTAEAQPMLLDTIWPLIVEALKEG
ncbi:MAG: arylesterase [Proteobacteria bacterium]|nr:arylesterase [Pseudomonadota bacterium]